MPLRVLVAITEEGDERVADLRREGFRVERCSPERVIEHCLEADPDVCLLESGSENLAHVVRELTDGGCGPALLVLAADAGLEATARALEAGAHGLLPVRAPRELLAATVAGAGRAATRSRELARLRAERERDDALVFLGSSAAVRQLEEAVDRVASTPRTTILIHGGRGSGRRAVARAVHARSTRADRPLLEADAGDPSIGADRIERAEGGTLVLAGVDRLDEVGQAALANLLADRGQEAPGPDVRLIATTDRDLEEEVEAGRFREDLSYRLNVLTLHVPSLAERLEDLPDLARGALERAAAALGRPELRLGDEFLAELAQRAWPGNLRELRLCVERAALTSPGDVLGGEAGSGAPEVPKGAARSAAGGPADLLESLSPALPLRDLSLRAAEEAVIRRVMQETGGNKLRSAEILGIHRTTLYQKLKSLGIE